MVQFGFSPHPSSWIDELREAAHWSPQERWLANSHSVDLVVAVTELLAWLNDERPYDGSHKNGWKSVLADVRFAANQVGPNLRFELGADVQNVLTATQGLPNIDLTVNQRAATTAPAALAAVEALNARLGTPGALGAAWLDLAGACENAATDYDVVATRRDHFWRIVHAADRSPSEISSLLTGVVSDSAMEVYRARAEIGEVTPKPSTDWPRYDEPANLNEHDRVELCKRLLMTPPRSAQHVVWLAFDKARIESMTTTFGPITFHEGHFVRSVMEHGGPNLPLLPSELTTADPYFKYDDLPDGNDIVLARVDLGNRAITDAPRVAADLTKGAVSVAKFYSSHRLNWIKLEGYLHFTNGRLSGHSTFNPAFERPSIAISMDGTGEQLAKHGSTTLGSRLLSGDQAASEIVRAVEWWQEAHNQGQSAALILHVRIIELIAARVDQSPWYTYLDTFMQSDWVWNFICDELLVVAYRALSQGPREADDESKRTSIAALEGDIVKYNMYGWRVDCVKALAALKKLEDLYPKHSVLSRRLRTLVARLDSPATVFDWSQSLKHEWEGARARLRRVRNSVAHGGPVTDKGIATVAAFARRLASWSISTSLDGVVGNGIVDEHRKRKAKADTWLAAVPNAPDVASSLFPA